MVHLLSTSILTTKQYAFEVWKSKLKQTKAIHKIFKRVENHDKLRLFTKLKSYKTSQDFLNYQRIFAVQRIGMVMARRIEGDKTHGFVKIQQFSPEN